MNENMQVWLETLKTGQYSQATGALDVVDIGTGQHSFCCLGVACDLAVKAGVDMEVRFDEGQDFVAYDAESGTLPAKVKDWLGIETTNPKIVVENPHYDAAKGEYWGEVYYPEVDRYQRNNPSYLINEYVTELNDEYNLTFDQIADLIEYAGGFSEEV